MPATYHVTYNGSRAVCVPLFRGITLSGYVTAQVIFKIESGRSCQITTMGPRREHIRFGDSVKSSKAS